MKGGVCFICLKKRRGSGDPDCLLLLSALLLLPAACLPACCCRLPAAVVMCLLPHQVCAYHEWNLDGLVEMVWEYLDLVR